VPSAPPEGIEEKIQCVSLGGSPPPQLKWYLGEKEIGNTQRNINRAGNVVSTMTLRMSRVDHGKAVRCEAILSSSNQCGRCQVFPSMFNVSILKFILYIIFVFLYCLESDILILLGETALC